MGPPKPYRISQRATLVSQLVQRTSPAYNASRSNTKRGLLRVSNCQSKTKNRTRPCWPRPSPCAKPQTLVAGRPGDRFELNVERFEGCQHLPIVTLRRAAYHDRSVPSRPQCALKITQAWLAGSLPKIKVFSGVFSAFLRRHTMSLPQFYRSHGR